MLCEVYSPVSMSFITSGMVNSNFEIMADWQPYIVMKYTKYEYQSQGLVWIEYKIHLPKISFWSNTKVDKAKWNSLQAVFFFKLEKKAIGKLELLVIGMFINITKLFRGTLSSSGTSKQISGHETLFISVRSASYWANAQYKNFNNVQRYSVEVSVARVCQIRGRRDEKSFLSLSCFSCPWSSSDAWNNFSYHSSFLFSKWK